MNLIQDAWIPIFRSDGSTAVVTPAEALASGVKELAFERADWNAAVTQFLVALLQTAIVHRPNWMADEDHWFERWEQGLDVVNFTPFSGAFDLDRAFQDIDSTLNNGAGNPVHITALLPDMPGDNAQRKNSDLFVWRERLSIELSEAEIAAALLATQMMGISWGGGFYNGPRGSGAISTLVVPNTEEDLWRTVLLNVLPYDRWVARYGDKPWDDNLIFPWLSPTIDGVVVPDMAHPLTAYWAVSKTLKLTHDGFVRRKGGRNYQGWMHPLSPHRQTDKGTFAMGIKQSHIGYHYWAGLVLGSSTNAPAAVVNEYVEHRFELGTLRLWLHGWHATQAEHHSWVDQMMPLVIAKDKERMTEETEQLLEITDRIKRSLAKRFTVLRLQSADAVRLYDRTEGAFYEALRVVAGGNSVAGEWLRQMQREALTLFDATAQQFRIDPVQLADERAKLMRVLWGNKLAALAA